MPLRCDSGVEIGQRAFRRHDVPVAVRTATVMRRCAIVHRGLPLVALFALPPHAHGGALADVRGKQIAVLLVVPLLRDLGIGLLQSARRWVHSDAVRTQIYASSNPPPQTLRGRLRIHALVDRPLPLVALLAHPPHILRARVRHCGREETVVLCGVPLRRNLGELGGERVGDGHALVVAERAADVLVVLVYHVPDARLPLVVHSLRTLPPHLLKGFNGHILRADADVLRRMP